MVNSTPNTTPGSPQKAMGLIGGMSWESTALYYKLINEGIKNNLGSHHSAHILLESLDFQPIKQFQHQNNWAAATDILVRSAQNLQKAGAEFLLICTNTMHKVAPAVEANIEIPLLHLADATAERIKAAGLNKVGFLGTKFSMEDDFYVGRLRDKHGLEVMVPNAADRETVHTVIYDELCLGVISNASRQKYLDIIHKQHEDGAQAIIEGCTEITLLVDQSHTDVPLFDTTAIHAEAAVKFSLNQPA